MKESLRQTLTSQLRLARARSDEIFQIVRREALYERPIAERHRIVFYLGHLEAFDWNLICAAIGMHSPQKEFNRLFAFGIDPTNGANPQDQPSDWPHEAEIRQYNARAREAVDDCLKQADSDQLFWVAIEHRLMHAETLAYMLHWLPFSMKHPQPFETQAPCEPATAGPVDIPEGIAVLGLSHDAGAFGWDNEFDSHPANVPQFAIDEFKVSNAQYLEFVREGGYSERSLWTDKAWSWITSSEIQHPRFWARDGNAWLCRTMFENVPFQPSWPVYVSHAEAEAYSRWKGKSLPTEAQFHRAAFGSSNGSERMYPWGDAPPDARYGNFDFQRWTPTPVNSHPLGKSAFGVSDLVGNGWEWTSTPFAPFPGFKRFEFYPGYSADFFDGNHYVMKGGSPRTAELLLRRSFRNWFQPHYPNIYASFRCVTN